ncbi:Di-copper centre-containing protein [Biscogniauxia mediterranea]|nr:Di-copper centre-containing protein [Biscogniauxia mediterranea]
MLLVYTTVLVLQMVTLASGKPTPASLLRSEVRDDTSDINKLQAYAQEAYAKAQAEVTGAGNGKRGGCSISNFRVRREWNALSDGEKRAYIDAVKCLQSKPARTPASAAPGAKTRFDDFVGVHINQTQTIHYTGNFLSWHRYFIWLYEEALRGECGYQGTQPYWDWPRTAVIGLANSTIFDGSDLSMSGDGAFVPDQADIVLGASSGLPPIYLPPGTGGGCVTSGPFKDMVVNLGPAALDTPGGVVVTSPDGPLAHNPRCLKRSLTDYANRAFANASSVLSNVVGPQNVYDFQMQMQGVPGSGDMGIHGGGHYALGGDPGRDVYASPGDPAFYLHHGMIDRVWWIWQMREPAARRHGDVALMGTNTFLDSPPSANTTFDDYVDYGYAAGPPRKIGELMSTTDGPFCYAYL